MHYDIWKCWFHLSSIFATLSIQSRIDDSTLFIGIGLQTPDDYCHIQLNDAIQQTPIHNQSNYIPDTIIQRNVIFRKSEYNINNNNYLNDQTNLDNLIIGGSIIKIRIIICTKNSISRYNTLLCYCVNSIFLFAICILQFLFLYLLDLLNPCPITFKNFYQLIFPCTIYFENNCISK